MIFLKICGRLGNQMFQYAFAKKIQTINPQHKIIIDFGDVDRIGLMNNDSTWTNELTQFRISNAEVFDRKNINIKESIFDLKMNLMQKVLLKTYSIIYRHETQEQKRKHQLLWAPIYAKFGIINNNYGFYQYGYFKNKNIFIKGFFENPQYFNDIRKTLIDEFTPDHPRLEKNSDIYKIIENNESVCISIRRGKDFSSSDKFNVCGTEYFEKAMSRIEDDVSDPVYIIFSDNIEYVKSEFNFEDRVVYFEDGSDPVWEKLRMMYLCKHYIISNSTFSWWAQYLSRNDQKIVIAPHKWWNNDDNAQIYENNWILL